MQFNSKRTRSHAHTLIKRIELIIIHTRAFKIANLKIKTCQGTIVYHCLRGKTTKTNALSSSRRQMSNSQRSNLERKRSLLTCKNAFINSNVLVCNRRIVKFHRKNKKFRLINIYYLKVGFRLIKHYK